MPKIVEWPLTALFYVLSPIVLILLGGWYLADKITGKDLQL